MIMAGGLPVVQDAIACVAKLPRRADSLGEAGLAGAGIRVGAESELLPSAGTEATWLRLLPVRSLFITRS